MDMSIILIVAATLTGIGIITVLSRGVSRIGSFLSWFRRGVEMGDTEAQNTPRSLSGIGDLVLPSVKRDFPEYNHEATLIRVKSDAHTFYDSARAGRVLFQSGISHELRVRLPFIFPKDVWDGIAIHKALMSAYDAVFRDRVLTFQIAAEYKTPSNEKKQRRLTLKYIAAYDADTQGEVRDFNCPNCGAPLSALGEKRCGYCGSALKVSSGIGWVLMDAEEN